MRTPLPYGSPRVTACGKAGTVTGSRPRYCEKLPTSPSAPPVALHVTPFSSGSTSVGARLPQTRRYHVLARLLLQPESVRQRTGNSEGGSVLDQSMFSRPLFVSWRTMLPRLTGASGGLPWSSVDHASVNVRPTWLFTVTFSLAGAPL